MPFGLLATMGAGNHVLDRGRYSQWEGTNWEDKSRPIAKYRNYCHVRLRCGHFVKLLYLLLFWKAVAQNRSRSFVQCQKTCGLRLRKHIYRVLIRSTRTMHTSVKARLTLIRIATKINFNHLFIGPLPTFPENFMQIRLKVVRKVVNSQTDKQTNTTVQSNEQRRLHSLLGGGNNAKCLSLPGDFIIMNPRVSPRAKFCRRSLWLHRRIMVAFYFSAFYGHWRLCDYAITIV